MCGLILAIAGLGFSMMALNRNIMNFNPQPIHPVTEPMRTSARKMSAKAAPDFKLATPEGKVMDLASVVDGRPTFIYFIKSGCPCSIDAEPMFQRLYKFLNEGGEQKVNFVAVTSGDAKAGAKWVKDMSVPYSVLCDTSRKIMKDYKAENSTYSVLLKPDGEIAKQWPGWSKRILQEINAEASALSNQPVREFDTAYAPKEDSSGCSFSEP